MSLETVEIGSSVSSLSSISTPEVGMPSVAFSPDLTSGFSGGGLYPTSYLDNLAPYPSFSEPSVEVVSNPFLQAPIVEPVVEAPSYMETLDLTDLAPRNLPGLELIFGNTIVPQVEVPEVKSQEVKSQVVDVIGSVLNLESQESVQVGELNAPTLKQINLEADLVQLKKVEDALASAQWEASAASALVTRTAQEMGISLEDKVVEAGRKIKKEIKQEKVSGQTLIAQVDNQALKAREYSLKRGVDQSLKVGENNGEGIIGRFSVALKHVSELVKGKGMMLNLALPYDGTMEATVDGISSIEGFNSKAEGYKLVDQVITNHLPVRVSDNLDTKQVSEKQIHEVLYGEKHILEIAPLAAEIPYLIDKKPKNIKTKMDNSTVSTQEEVDRLIEERTLLMIRIQEAEIAVSAENNIKAIAQ